ncbi:MAG: cation:dicarboxylate symporter family transporter [Alphaproteobacteria bacterium]
MMSLFSSILRFRPNLITQLGIALLVALFFGPMIPEFYRSIFYTFSVQVQEILIFFLPFIIFSYLFSCLINFENNIIVFLLSVLAFVLISNFLSLMYAYGLGVGCFNFMKIAATEIPEKGLQCLGCLRLPKIPNDYALISGTIVGSIFFYFKNDTAMKVSVFLKKGADFFLKKLFIPIVPFFIFGFMVKMSGDGILAHTLQAYAPVFIAAILAQVVYICVMFGIVARFRIASWKAYIRNSMPMAVTGFSTMSSAATMPLLLDSAEKNTNHSPVVRAYIPAAVNVHHVGDGIVLPIVMMATLLTFGMPLPDFSTYLMFSLYYLVLKFGSAGVPGGGVMVMMPILQGLMGFDPTMQGFVMGLYMLFDPFITVTNVMCNGAAAIGFAHVFGKKHKP